MTRKLLIQSVMGEVKSIIIIITNQVPLSKALNHMSGCD